MIPFPVLIQREYPVCKVLYLRHQMWKSVFRSRGHSSSATVKRAVWLPLTFESLSGAGGHPVSRRFPDHYQLSVEAAFPWVHSRPLRFSVLMSESRTPKFSDVISKDTREWAGSGGRPVEKLPFEFCWTLKLRNFHSHQATVDCTLLHFKVCHVFPFGLA